eukprot:scaffold20124_cov66-Skeletonema_marinoi.AAC.1
MRIDHPSPAIYGAAQHKMHHFSHHRTQLIAPEYRLFFYIITRQQYLSIHYNSSNLLRLAPLDSHGPDIL